MFGESDDGCKSALSSLMIGSEDNEDGVLSAISLGMLAMGSKNEEDGAGSGVILFVLDRVGVLGSFPFVGWRPLNSCLICPFSVAILFGRCLRISFESKPGQVL